VSWSSHPAIHLARRMLQCDCRCTEEKQSGYYRTRMILRTFGEIFTAGALVDELPELRDVGQVDLMRRLWVQSRLGATQSAADSACRRRGSHTVEAAQACFQQAVTAARDQGATRRRTQDSRSIRGRRRPCIWRQTRRSAARSPRRTSGRPK